MELESGLRGVWRESEPNGKMVERGHTELERGNSRPARECLACARRAKRRAHKERAMVDTFVSSFTPCVAPADRGVRANCSLRDPCTHDISHEAHSARSALHDSLNSRIHGLHVHAPSCLIHLIHEFMFLRVHQLMVIQNCMVSWHVRMICVWAR